MSSFLDNFVWPLVIGGIVLGLLVGFVVLFCYYPTIFHVVAGLAFAWAVGWFILAARRTWWMERPSINVRADN